VLRQGGNAVDAALAGTLAACVAEVVFTSLGGGGFMMIRQPGGETTVMDFFANTPGLGQKISDVEPDFTPLTVHYPGSEQVFYAGPGSVAVPGALGGYLAIHEQHGRLPLSDIVAPAAHLGEEGTILEPVQAVVLELVREIMSLTDECRRLISKHGRYARAGDRITNPDFARFLRLLGEGRLPSLAGDAFATPMSSLMEHTGGHVTTEDLRAYQVVQRAPIELERDGVEINLNAPPAFGGSIVADTLRELAPIKDDPRDWATVVAELGRATTRTRTVPGPKSSQGTTHISVVDSEGRIASMTTSNGSGSGVVLPGTGIHLNNMLGEEDLNPDGFHAAPPGIRISSMMTPAILSFASGATCGLGTGGSERIRSALLGVILNLVDLRQPLASAVAAPRLHPDQGLVQLEPGWGAELPALLGKSQVVNTWASPNLYFGGVHAVARDPEGAVVAVGDARRGGAALVVQPA